MISRALSFRLPSVRHGVDRYFSASPLKIDLRQGHNLHIVLQNTASNVVISSAWQDHGDIESDYKVDVKHNASTNTFTVTPLSESQLLKVQVPEYVNLRVDSNAELNLLLENKIQGDCIVNSPKANVTINKLRGEILEFNCGQGDIIVKKSLEGSAQVNCRSLTAKKLFGDVISANCSGRVTAEAIYAPACVIQTVGEVEVGLMSGSLQAYSAEGHVSVAGIDGSFEVIADVGTIRLQINKLYPESTSSATAVKGHIVANVDPELKASLLCQCESYHSTRAKVTVVSDDFVRTEYAEERTEDKKESYTPYSSGTMQGSRVTGYLSGNSKATKRSPLYGYFATGSGKINLKEAEVQSLRYRAALAATDGGAVDTKGTDASATGAAKPDEEYNLQFRANGNIRVETLSWIEAIRRKHGFGDDADSQGTVPHRQPGRTASAGIRAAQANPNKYDSDDSSGP